MLTLMNYWNSVWRGHLAEIEKAFDRHSAAEDRAFERQLSRTPTWQIYSGNSVRSVSLPDA